MLSHYNNLFSHLTGFAKCIQLKHNTGPSKVNPPLLPTKARSAEELQLQSAAVTFCQQRDAAWLSQVHGSDRPVEWAGFNAQQDRLVAGRVLEV